MTQPIVSVAIAAHNVDQYIRATFTSIDRQTVDLANIEFIIVDDGSVDQTLEIARGWAKGKSNVHVLSQENQGVAGARQTALDQARGVWFTSVDPDDMIDRDYFRNILNFLTSKETQDVQMAVTNIIFMNDSTGRLSNRHALRHRFDRGNRIAVLNDEPQNIQLGATALLLVDSIRKYSIKYDRSVKPTFEDGHFIGRYLAHFSDPKIGIISDAKYYYRKRQNTSSLVQSSWSNIDKYSTVLENGYLDLLRTSRKISGRVPQWIQFMVVYDIFWYFLEDSKQFSRAAWLDANARQKFLDGLHAIFEHIDVETIIDFNIYELPISIRQAVLIELKNIETSCVCSNKTTKDVSHIELYLSLDTELPKNGQIVNTIVHSFFGFPFCREVRLHSSNAVSDSNSPCLPHATAVPSQASYASGIPYFTKKIKNPEQQHWHRWNLIEIRQKFTRARELIQLRMLATNGSNIDVSKTIFFSIANRLKRSVKSKFERQRRIQLINKSRHVDIHARYANAWCFMDRPDKADDNAEHLYRHVVNSRPEINAYFILKRSSPDWSRLSLEGFKLLEPNSDELSLAVLNSQLIISSDAVAECMYPVHRALVGRSNSSFVFLQHGVLMNDLSRWLNPKNIDLIMTSTPAEHLALTGIDSPYEIAPGQVSLAGLSRFDELLRKRGKTSREERNLILIMPTWRHELSSKLATAKSRIEKRNIFETSQFYREWYGLISSESFKSSVASSRLEAVFVPHPSLRSFIDLIEFPDHVKLAEYNTVSIQDYISFSKLLITDYSSISFDAAYIKVPTIYFQFDRTEIFGGTHNFRPGYFSYEDDGFGPVIDNVADAIVSIDNELSKPEIYNAYQNRFYAAFPRSDSKNSERILDFLEAFLDAK